MVCKAPAGRRFCTGVHSDEDFLQTATPELMPENATPHPAAELPSNHSAAAPFDPPVRAKRILQDSSGREVSVSESVRFKRQTIQVGLKLFYCSSLHPLTWYVFGPADHDQQFSV